VSSFNHQSYSSHWLSINIIFRLDQCVWQHVSVTSIKYCSLCTLGVLNKSDFTLPICVMAMVRVCSLEFYESFKNTKSFDNVNANTSLSSALLHAFWMASCLHLLAYAVTYQCCCLSWYLCVCQFLEELHAVAERARKDPIPAFIMLVYGCLHSIAL